MDVWRDYRAQLPRRACLSGLRNPPKRKWRRVERRVCEKNELAEASVFTIVVSLTARSVCRWWRLLAFAASAVLVVLAGSATGFLVCLVLVATLPLLKLVQARPSRAVPIACSLLLVLGVLASVLSGSGPEVFRLLDRSPDLTGRTDLWDAVLVSISKRPWLGYGFSAFWQGTNGESGSGHGRSRLDSRIRSQWLFGPNASFGRSWRPRLSYSDTSPRGGVRCRCCRECAGRFRYGSLFFCCLLCSIISPKASYWTKTTFTGSSMCLLQSTSRCYPRSATARATTLIFTLPSVRGRCS